MHQCLCAMNDGVYIFDASMKDESFQQLTLHDLHPAQQMTIKNHLLHTLSLTDYDKISDDSWINIFCYCDVKDIFSINLVCNHFHSLINDKNHNNGMDQCWKHQCQSICKDIEILNFKPDNWKKLCIALCKLLDTRNVLKFTTGEQHYSLCNKRKSLELFYYKSMQLLPITFAADKKHKHDQEGTCIIAPCSDGDENNKYSRLLQIAIISACQTDNILVFQLLSKYLQSFNDILVGKDKFNNGDRKQTPLGAAVCHSSHKIIRYLLNDDNINLCSQLPALLPKAAANLDEMTVKWLLNHPRMTLLGINMTNTSYNDRETPLHSVITRIYFNTYHEGVVEKGLKIISLLLNDPRTDANLLNDDEQTPLTQAIDCYTLNRCPKEVVLELIKSPKINVTLLHRLMVLYLDERKSEIQQVEQEIIDEIEKKYQQTKSSFSMLY